jgi:uncharacterized protein YkwD
MRLHSVSILKFLFGVFSSLTILVSTLSNATAQNSMELPQISARTKKNGKIIVTVSLISAGVDAVILQRKVGKGKFTTVATKKPKGTKITFSDLRKGKKAQRYRAQFRFKDSPTSNWSVESVATEKSGVVASVVASQESNCSPGFLDTLHTLINSARSSNGLSSLSLLPTLQKSAQVHSNKMSARGVLSHDGWIEGIRAAGFASPIIGQNVANGFPTPEAVVNAWLASPGHRANILSRNYTFSGFGCTTDARGFTWWTNDFGG